MTRYENFMAIAHAYYDAYVSQAVCLGKKPLSYDEWLGTDKSKAPGFAEEQKCEPKCEPKCQGQCRDKNGRFVKDKGIGELRKIAEQVARERGPAPEIKAKPLAEKPEVDEEFTVISNGKVLTGDEAKKFLIARGLIKPDNEDSEESDKDDDDDYKFAMKDADNFFKSVFGRDIKDFL